MKREPQNDTLLRSYRQGELREKEADRLQPHDDKLLRSYLLGELREEEADRLERRLLKEDELFELAEAVEADLLAAADRGELAPAERERVLRRLASSPQGRERLALARSLNAMAAEQVSVVVPFRRRVSTLVSPAIRWAALAASLLMVPSLVWLAWNHRWEASDDVKRVVVPAAPVDVLALTLQSLRGAGEEVVAELHLSPDSRTAEFQIDMEGTDAKSFNVAIHREERTIWEKSALKPIQMSGSPVLVVDVPAKILSAGRYEIAVTPEGESEEIQEFKVVQTNC